MEQNLAIKSEPKYTQEQITLIQNTVAKGASADEFKLFMVIAKRAGLDPFTKQIHFVKRGGAGTIQTGIDGYRAIAERSGQLAGIDDAIYDDETNVHPTKASVTVHKIVAGIKVNFTASARWEEYCPKPPNDFMWKKMPYLMLAKCAEALALRKAFPNDLSGIYTNEEMEQAKVVSVSSMPVTQKSPIAPLEDEVVDELPIIDMEQPVNWKEKMTSIKN